MRIAIISVHASPLAAPGDAEAGGQTAHVAELSAALAAAGHQVRVYTRRDNRRVPSEVDTPGGFRVVHVPAGPPRRMARDELVPHLADFTRHVARRWRADPPDVVHSHFWMSGVVAVFAGLDRHVPVVHSYHGLGAVERRHLGRADTSPADRIRLERLIGRSASRIVATCREEAVELGRLGVPPDRVSVVPFGVDTTRFIPEGPAAPRTWPRRVVSVGRLVPRAGFAALVAALPFNPETELLVVGGPPASKLAGDEEAVRLSALARKYGVTDRVRLTGRLSREHLPEVLRSADVVACTPWYGPSGSAPLEAMACGVPVLATAVGGLTDTVVDGVTGVLVPPRRPGSLANALRGLLADPTRREFLGAAGRDRAESRYPWPRIAADTLRAYERCLPVTPAEPLVPAG